MNKYPLEDCNFIAILAFWAVLPVVGGDERQRVLPHEAVSKVHFRLLLSMPYSCMTSRVDYANRAHRMTHNVSVSCTQDEKWSEERKAYWLNRPTGSGGIPSSPPAARTPWREWHSFSAGPPVWTRTAGSACGNSPPAAGADGVCESSRPTTAR